MTHNRLKAYWILAVASQRSTRSVALGLGLRRGFTTLHPHDRDPRALSHGNKELKSLAFKVATAISQQRRQLEWQAALQVFWAYVHRVRRDVLIPPFNAAIAACEVGSCWQLAMSLMADASTFALAPNAVTATALMSACRRGHQWQRALHIFKHFAADGSADAGLLGIAISCTACGHLWQSALHLLDLSDRLGVRNLALQNASILACEKARRWEAALHLLEEAVGSSGLGLSGTALTSVTVNLAVSACQKARQWGAALRLAARFARSADVVGETVAIGALGAARRWQEALRRFRALEALEASPCQMAAAHTATAFSLERATCWEIALVLATPLNRRSAEMAAIAAARTGRWQVALLMAQSHFGKQLAVQSCEQSGCWGVDVAGSSQLIDAVQRWKVDLEGGALRGRGEHVEILVRPGAAPSNAIWCVTARDWLEQRLV
ncbi:unnamed protein product, partial [Effrenium voratum]